MVAKIMNVVFTEEEYKKILKEAEDNVRESVTRQVVDKYLKDTSKFIYITERILELGISDRLEKIKNKKVKDLNDDEKLCFILNALNKGLHF